MPHPYLPSIAWQPHSQLDTRSVHSLLIALLRGLAALEVAAAHLRAEVFPGVRELADPPLYYQLLTFATGFSHQAVIVFFLISGWLVGGSLMNKRGQATATSPWVAYAIDRLTRLWTVLLPALCLMLLIGSLTGRIDAARPDFSADNDYSALTFAGNLVGLQTIVVKTFGGNYALWSLANETWYYIQFPLLLLVFTARTRPRQLAAAALLVLLGTALPAPITLYFALWLLGAAFSRIRIDCGRTLRMALVLATIGGAVYFRLGDGIDDLAPSSFLPHLAYSLPLLALLSSLQAPLDPRSPWLRFTARIAHFLSEFSFTLYVLHVPLIRLMRHAGLQLFGRARLAADAPLDYALYAAMLGMLVALAYLSYLLFESHTARVRRALKAVLASGTRRSGYASSSMK